MRTLAQATDRKRRAASSSCGEAAARIDRVRLAVRGRRRVRAWRRWSGSTRCSSAGHWTPQLIELAGGEDVLGLPGEHSQERRLGGGRGGRSPTSSS